MSRKNFEKIEKFLQKTRPKKTLNSLENFVKKRDQKHQINLAKNTNYKTSERSYENYAYVVDINPKKKPPKKHKDKKIIIGLTGNSFLLLELLLIPGISVNVGERIYIGKNSRDKIFSILKKTRFENLSPSAKNNFPKVIEKIIYYHPEKFSKYSKKTITHENVMDIYHDVKDEYIIRKNKHNDAKTGVIRKVPRVDW